MKVKSFDFYLHLSFAVTSVLLLYMTLKGSETERMITSSLPVLSLLILYFRKNVKKKVLIVLSMLFMIISNVLLVKDNLFNVGMLSITLSHLALINVVMGYIKKINRKYAYFYFIAFLIFFLIMFYIVFGGFNEVKDYSVVILYGIVTSFLGGVAFANYLFKMSYNNFILFLGVFLGTASDSIYGIGILIQGAVYYNFFGILLYTLSSYFIYTGIFLIESESIKRR